METPRMNKMFEDSLLILAMIKNLVADGLPPPNPFPAQAQFCALGALCDLNPRRDLAGNIPTRFLPKSAVRRSVRLRWKHALPNRN